MDGGGELLLHRCGRGAQFGGAEVGVAEDGAVELVAHAGGRVGEYLVRVRVRARG